MSRRRFLSRAAAALASSLAAVGVGARLRSAGGEVERPAPPRAGSGSLFKPRDGSA